MVCRRDFLGSLGAAARGGWPSPARAARLETRARDYAAKEMDLGPI
jgi:hypothetical protein